MIQYIGRRIIAAFVTIVGVTFLLHSAVRLLPGDVLDTLSQNSRLASGAESRARIEHELGLDKPLVIGYWNWIQDVSKGDLGHSLLDGRPVANTLREALPVTAELSFMTLVFTIMFGIPFGIVAAVYQDRWFDYAVRSVAVFLLAVPGFLIASIMIVVTTKQWGWNPPIRYIRLVDDPLANLAQFALPAAILGFGSAAALMRFTRSAMLDVYRQDYVRTARAKGLGERYVVLRHAARNSLIPVTTIIGLFLAQAFGGTVIFERIFQLPGMGRTMIHAVNSRDYPVVQAIALIFALGVILVNLVTDIIYTIVDPRVRY